MYFHAVGLATRRACCLYKSGSPRVSASLQSLEDLAFSAVTPKSRLVTQEAERILVMLYIMDDSVEVRLGLKFSEGDSVMLTGS